MTRVAWTFLLVLGGLLLVVVISILAMAVIRARRRAQQDDNRTLPEVAVYLETLLRRGHNRAFIIITDVPTDVFVQFAKYIRPEREIGLQLGFPRAPWSESFYERLQSFLDRHRIPFSIQPTGDEPVTEMLHVDCQRDVQQAVFLVERIFRDVFNVPTSHRFRVRGEGMSFKDELIDTRLPDE